MSINIKTGTVANGFNRVSQAYVRTADNPTGARVLDGWVCTAVTDGVPTEWLPIFGDHVDDRFIISDVTAGFMQTRIDGAQAAFPWALPTVSLHPLNKDVVYITRPTRVSWSNIAHYSITGWNLATGSELFTVGPTAVSSLATMLNTRGPIETYFVKTDGKWYFVVNAGLFYLKDWPVINVEVSGTYNPGTPLPSRAFSQLPVGVTASGMFWPGLRAMETNSVTGNITVAARTPLAFGPRGYPSNSSTHLGQHVASAPETVNTAALVNTFIYNGLKQISMLTGNQPAMFSTLSSRLVRFTGSTTTYGQWANQSYTSRFGRRITMDGIGAIGTAGSRSIHSDNRLPLMPGQRSLSIRHGPTAWARRRAGIQANVTGTGPGGSLDNPRSVNYTNDHFGFNLLKTQMDNRNRNSSSSIKFQVNGVNYLCIVTHNYPVDENAAEVNGEGGFVANENAEGTVRSRLLGGSFNLLSTTYTFTVYNLDEALRSTFSGSYVPWWRIIRFHGAVCSSFDSARHSAQPRGDLGGFTLSISNAWINNGQVLAAINVNFLQSSAGTISTWLLPIAFNETAPTSEPVLTDDLKMPAGDYSMAWKIGEWHDVPAAPVWPGVFAPSPDGSALWSYLASRGVNAPGASKSLTENGSFARSFYVPQASGDRPYGMVRVYAKNMGEGQYSIVAKIYRFQSMSTFNLTMPNTYEVSEDIILADCAEFDFMLSETQPEHLSFRNITAYTDIDESMVGEGVAKYIVVAIVPNLNTEKPIIARIDLNKIFPTPF